MKPSFPPEPRIIKWAKRTVLVMGLMLAGCAEPNPALVVHKNVVHVPPAALFYCPVSTLPQSFTSNAQVAQALNTTYGNNVVCHNNMNALRSDLNSQAKAFK